MLFAPGWMLAASAALLLGLAVPARAEPVTFHGITVDRPSGWTVAETDRGMKLVSADGAVNVWFEAYAGGERAVLADEWIAFWQMNDVVFSSEPSVGTGRIGGFDESFRAYHSGATWKGRPTYVDFIDIGPVGPDGEMVQMTSWANLESLKAADDDIARLLGGFAVEGGD